MADDRSRQLTLIDCFGLGVNGIVGSGIFLLPAVLARRAGGAAPLAWLLVGGLCTLIALSFAEAASRTDRSGGPYRYACDAFGPTVGFVVGWVTLASSMLGYAAVSRGFAEHALLVLPLGPIGEGARAALRGGVVIALVGGLGALNAVGVRPGARTGDAVGAIKVLALVAFAVLALALGGGPSASSALAPGGAGPSGLLAAAAAGLFACTGFEYVPVPAGETRRPERAIGLAMVVSVVGATLLYAALQHALGRLVPDLGRTEAPLVEGARALGGDAAARAMAVLGLVSAFGFCSGSALVAPRYVESFAHDRFLPPALGRRSARLGTPLPAILLTSGLVAALGLSLDFAALADTSNVAVVAQYLATCGSVLVTRRRATGGFRLPLGPLIPLAGIGGSLVLLSSIGASELRLAGGLVGAGLGLGLVTRSVRR